MKIVERVVEKVVIRQDPQCLQKLEQAHRLISAATERLQQSGAEEKAPILFSQISEAEAFPTMAEVTAAPIHASDADEEEGGRPPPQVFSSALQGLTYVLVDLARDSRLFFRGKSNAESAPARNGQDFELRRRTCS